MTKTIALLPGDGIGPEITAPTVELLNKLGDFAFERAPLRRLLDRRTWHGPHGRRARRLQAADAVLLAAVGGPKWDTTDPSKPRPEQGLLGLRKGLGLYANLRPVRPVPALYDASPLKREVDRGDRPARDARADRRPLLRQTRPRRRHRLRHVHLQRRGDRADRARRLPGRADAASRASTRPTCSSPRGCGARSSTRVHAEEFPHVELEHVLVDNAAMQLISNPAEFDVIVTENMFGDILSDEAAMLTGSIGLLPSASLGGDGPGLFEPVHGSAPDIAGQGIANPLAMFLSAALMLRHGLAMENEAATVESAVDRALADGLRTRRPGRYRDHGRGCPGRPEPPLRSRRGPSGPHLDERRARRLGGREGPRTHALPALRHGRVRGRCERTRPTAGTAIFRHSEHLDRLYKSAELYYMPIPYTLEELRSAVHDVVAQNGLPSCYIRPIVFRGAGVMGINPLDAPVDVVIAAWPWGAYLGDEAKDARRAREGLQLAAHQRRLADPAREGLGPVPQQRAREDRERESRLRRGDPARRARLRLRGHRREHLRRARWRHLHAAADGRDPRRHQPPVGHPDRAPTRASSSSSAISRAPSSTSPTSCS